MLPNAATAAPPAALQAALDYHRRGWAVIPVEWQGKRPLNPDDPRHRDWQKLRPSEADLTRWFGASPRNVGVLLGEASGGLVDIDLDSPEALTLAPQLLPKTEAVFGRASKTGSHRLYTAPGAKTRQYKDPVRGDMLLELRAAGAQTVFPPSRHVSREAVEWAHCGDPLQVTPERLAREAATLAAAAALARAWPGQGGRHDASLTLVGLLKRSGWLNDRVAHFVACVSAAAGGEGDFVKRLAMARDAADRLAADRPVRGFPALADLVGEAVARKVAEWLGIALHSVAAGTNAQTGALAHGSHLAQAHAALARLREEHGEIVHCEGQFWMYDGSVWRAAPPTLIRKAVHGLDAAPIQGRNRPVSLTKASIDGVANEMAVLAAEEKFFDAGARGFNCGNGFAAIEADGGARLVAHDAAHRKRHMVRGAWSADAPPTPPKGSLFARFLSGSFGGGEDARELTGLLAEAAGIAAVGTAKDLKAPVAIILFGPTAANGKSQLLDLLRGLVSPEAAAALSPDEFGDEKRLVKLAGRTLNACDELGGSAMFAEPFKRIISCEPIGAREVYQSAFEFRPQALHVFATNELPAFRRGLDRGVQRRALIVPMTRSIPEAEQVPQIAQRILETEADLVLAWAVAGACRALARGDLARPRACEEAKRAWIANADVVLSWLHDEEEVTLKSDAWIASRDAYAAFRAWAGERGFVDLPNINVFSARIFASGVGDIRKHRKAQAAGISGLALSRAPTRRIRNDAE